MFSKRGVAFQRQGWGCYQLCIAIGCREFAGQLSCGIDFALAFPRHQADHEVGITYRKARVALDGSRRVLNDDGVSPEKLDGDGHQLKSLLLSLCILHRVV